MMRRTANRLFAFLKRDLLETYSYPTAFGMEVFGVSGSILSFYFLSVIIGDRADKWTAMYGGGYFPFALIGLAFSNYLGVALNGCRQSIRYSQLIGTLELMTMTKASPAEIVVYSSAYSFIWTTCVAASHIVIGKLFFRVSFAQANILSAALVFVAMIVPLYCLGIISAAFTIVLKRNDPFTWFIGVVSATFGGVIYPTNALPQWIRVWAEALPMTSGLNGLRLAMLQGATVADLAPLLSVLLVWTAVLVPLAALALHSSMRIAMRNGVLAHY